MLIPVLKKESVIVENYRFRFELSNVYNRLADIYRRYDYPSYRWLVRSEKRWIRERNTDCYDMSNRCIRRKYNQRIDYLYRLLKDY